MDKKFLQTLVRLERRVVALREHPVVCAFNGWGEQLTARGMAEVARYAEIAVRDDETSLYPWRVQAIFDGVCFFAIGTKQEFIEAGIFDLVAKQAGVPNG